MPSLLFVCTANQIRSPFAAAYFESLLAQQLGGESERWQVDSAGTWAQKGQPADPLLVSAARGWGLDLSAHRTRQVNHALLEGSGLVLVMEKGQQEALTYEFPAFTDQICRMTDFQTPPYDIPDPRGLALKQYQACLKDIAAVLASSCSDICQRVSAT